MTGNAQSQPSTAGLQAEVPAWNAAQHGAPPERILAWAAARFHGALVFASSLGAEDQAITAMIAAARLDIPIITLDTGRLFPETVGLLGRTEARYGLRIEILRPDATEVEAMVQEHGTDLFRDSVEKRKLCCDVRKVRPLKRALAGRVAWICGLRTGQAATRQAVQSVEWDAVHGMVMINPLAAWSDAQVQARIAAEGIPVNPLHAQGFPSIGCACCTRAVRPGEDIRAGRWWWEAPEHKECGLHGRRET